ncbi:unnamed protein product, partial [Symbiodinium necroappetens]
STGQCRSDFEGRLSKISMPTPQNSTLQYRTKATCELAPLIVYADFEVFSQDYASGTSALGCQNRVVAVGYAAVGMCGYEPPEEHRMSMIHARHGEPECSVVLKLILAMMSLADHFKDWRLHRRNLVWLPGQREAHHSSETCRECGRTFDSETKGLGKVAHHEHGSGLFLASLCQDCNKAAHKPNQVTICFHNGGHYDFHFVLRTFSKLTHAISSDLKGREHDPGNSVKSQDCQKQRRKIRKFGVKELARKVEKVGLRCLLDSLPGDAVNALKNFKVTTLRKSGETNLVMNIGPLCFIDTMNFCKAGLGKLIESHRKAVLKPASLGNMTVVSGLETAFPLKASRHPLLRNSNEDVWSALLRKLPMPWDFFSGCDDFDKPPETANFMGFTRFQDVFDAYLALDITAYADLMQIFRRHFFETHHLDPFLYPTLPSAAWDAALRDITQRRDKKFRLITNLEIYADVRKALMGGLCAIFRPHSEANFEGMEGYNAQISAKSALYLDINSMYPHAMTKHLPFSGGCAVKLPECEGLKLEWLHGILDSLNPLEDRMETIYLVFVDYDFPEEFHDAIDWPSPCRMAVPAEEVGPYNRDVVRGRKPVEKLVPYLGFTRFNSWPLLKSFMDRSYAYRRELKDEGRDTEQGFVKLTVNSIYGKTVQNQERFHNSTHYFDPVSFSRAQAGRPVMDFGTDIFERDAFMGTVYRVRKAKSNVNRSPVQVGWAVLEESKLDLAIKYWVGLKSAAFASGTYGFDITGQRSVAFAIADPRS